MPETDSKHPLKIKTARAVKWNFIDRVGSQVLYAVTGVVLARLLTQEQYGLVGAAFVFQAFASLLIDSGFASALIQRKAPTRLDYSSVLWFNMAVAVMLYVILWVGAPLIADYYHDDRLIGLSRVMFISLIVNAAFIVQANILMKNMDVSKIAMSNASGLVAGAVTGITLAVAGFGAWAIVWQTLAISVVKTASLWILARWLPLLQFSWASLRSFLPIASKMMFTSFLSTLFQNIYALVIGNRVGMASLGYYTQSDKWSKMSIVSVSQTLTASFMPALAEAQDDVDRFKNMCSRMHRFTAYVLIPVTVGAVVLATPLFHLLFGEKWDASIILFQLLMVRGVFTVLCSLYNNYLLALGKAKAIMWLEVFRDASAIAALVITLPGLSDSLPGNEVWGLERMLWWQLGAAGLTWAASLGVTVRLCDGHLWTYIRDLLPYLVLSLAAVPVMLWLMGLTESSFFALIFPALFAIVFYIGANSIFGSQIQREVFSFIRGRKIND